MARRNESLATLIISASAKFPWWISIGLAGIAYFGLGLFSDVPVETTSNMQDMGRVVTKQMFISVARILQYVLPFYFLIGAVVSIISSRKKKRLYGHLVKNPKLQTLNETSWREFELLVGQFFQQQGYTVRQLAQTGPDDGIDLVVIKDGDKYLVQCKQWRATRVGVKVVRELLGAIAAKGAVGGFVVTSGEFTESASDFVRGRNIELIDGREIIRRVSPDSIDLAEQQAPEHQPLSQNPSCPNCNLKMVLRTARQGSNAGNQFWGCSSYPKCRGIRGL